MIEVEPFRMERVCDPEICPLEISDVRVDGETLWQSSHWPEFPSALRQVLVGLRQGTAMMNPAGPAPAMAAGFDAVFITGGRVERNDLRAALVAVASPVYFAEEPAFAGEAGGFELLRARGFSGWVADLGKSRFKLSAAGHRWIFPRNWKRLRTPASVSPAEVPAQRRRLREFIALGLQQALTEVEARPNAIVFALPEKLGTDGRPASSNYAGMREDRSLASDALELAGLRGVTLLVLNDAELAALSARCDPRLAGFRKVLVLTLGFGIGAAVLQRSR